MSLRVVAGSAGGLHLKVPKKAALRPTQDRIKQAMFSSLGDFILGARVMDLFAGTGALGVEALSRGANSVRFVEQQRECVDCIRDNLRSCQLTGEVVSHDVFSYLRQTPPSPFDLIFADPPYEKTFGPVARPALLEALRPWLRSGGWLVLEHFSGQTLESPNGWRLDRSRRYGETAVTYFERVAEKAAESKTSSAAT